MSIAVGPDVIEDGLVLCLDAGDRNSYAGSGSTWYDLSGNGNNGTLVNNPTFNSNNGGSFGFDGTNDYVTINANNGFDFGSSDFTIQLWCYDLNGGPIISNGDNGSWTTGGWSIDEFGNDTADFFIHRFLYIKSNGTLFSTNIYVHKNRWSHITICKNNNNVFFYLDGSLETTASSPGNLAAYTGTNDLSIGSRRSGGSGLGSYILYQEGQIPSILIYKNKTLSAQEIRQNFNATKGRFGL